MKPLLEFAPSARLLPAPAEPDFDVLRFDASDYGAIDADWQALQAAYADLPLDVYMPPGSNYRFRRFGRFSLDLARGRLSTLADRAFLQSPEVNRLNGGILRAFAPLTPALRANRALRQLIDFHAAALRLVNPEMTVWKVYVHLIRIAGCADRSGKPTPEGLHQDGHHFVAQVLVARENVTGAESRVLDPKGRLILATTLQAPLDSLLVNDRTVFHEVTELHCLNAATLAWRDMLLIDFNPLGPHEAPADD